MKQADEITLKAFLIALQESNKILPKAELNQLQHSDGNLDKYLSLLDAIAERDSELDEIYQRIRSSLQSVYVEKNKGGLPRLPEEEPNNTEIENIMLVSLSQESQDIVKMESKTLLEKLRNFKNRVRNSPSEQAN